MSAVLNTNIASLWASKNLLGAQNKLAASVERLSSGLRINRARDDAAGLGVANSLTAQINGANQGIRNLNDAISMVQTAEGAIAAASDMGQRILMLATQGANSTLGSTERRAILTEMSQLISSINSISTRTEFTGNPLLTGAVNSGDILYSMQISNVATDVVAMETKAFANIGSGASVSGYQALSASYNADGGSVSGSGVGKVTIGNTEIVGATSPTAFKIKQSDGTYLDITVDFDDTADTVIIKDTASTPHTISTIDFVDTPNGLDIFTFYATNAGSGHASNLNSAINNAISTLNDYDTDTADAAQVTTKFQAIQSAADAYVIALGTQRSQLGAYQNQMEYTLSNITELSSNLQSARSRVIDTDYASETAALTKGQILQQAATAMLAQANQMPNVILTLLK